MNVLYFVIGLVVGFAIGAVIRHFELKKLANEKGSNNFELVIGDDYAGSMFKEFTQRTYNIDGATVGFMDTPNTLYPIPINFSTREYAEQVIEEIKEHLKRRIYISERDIFEISEIPISKSSNENVWYNIVDSRITSTPDGFVILLPKPQIKSCV